MSEQALVTPNTTPDKTFTLVVGDQARELFMSYGLLDTLIRLVPDTDEIGNLYVDADKRKAVLEALVAERSKSGKIIQAFDIEDLEVDIEVVDALLQWAVEHLAGFFIRSMTNIAKLAEQNIQAQEKAEAALTPQT